MSDKQAPLHVGIIVGEPSGDALGYHLLSLLKSHHPDLKITGVVGPEIKKLGATELYPMENLSMMGFWEPLKNLPKLLAMQKQLKKTFLAGRPDLFVGIDSPDFNLPLEKTLKAAGIPVLHYVSPSVWAWRQGRIKTIKQAVDQMFTLFPFETGIYDQHQIPATFVGHPLARHIPLNVDTAQAKKKLGFDQKTPIIALMPGSRSFEHKALMQPFIDTAIHCKRVNPDIEFVMPLVSQQHRQRLGALMQKHAPQLPVHYYVKQNDIVLPAIDCALVASGTATLELMLYKKPMAVAYRVNPITYQIMKRLLKIKHIALPNLLADKTLVPEFIQQALQPARVARTLLDFLEKPQAQLLADFEQLHEALSMDADQEILAAMNTLIK